jgi:two-component system, NarL family, response regulator YdfI
LIRVLVWAKSGITRAGLEAIVQADSRFELAGASSRPVDLVSAVRELAPDVVLLDLSGTSIARLAPGSSDSPTAPAVVVLMEAGRRADVMRALQSGVRAAIARESHPHEITAALQAANDGLAVFSPEILEVLVPTATELTGADELPPGEPLTSRESDVLALLAEGAGNKEIALRLGISEHTVKFHVSSILSKLGAATRTEAVARGYKEGLILM